MEMKDLISIRLVDTIDNNFITTQATIHLYIVGGREETHFDDKVEGYGMLN